MMSPILSSFRSTVPLMLCRMLVRSLCIVSHCFFSEDPDLFTRFISTDLPLHYWFGLGGLHTCLCLLYLAWTSFFLLLMSCELWWDSGRWTSFDWLDWLLKKYVSMQVPCFPAFKHFFLPWCIFRPSEDDTKIFYGSRLDWINSYTENS